MNHSRIPGCFVGWSIVTFRVAVVATLAWQAGSGAFAQSVPGSGTAVAQEHARNVNASGKYVPPQEANVAPAKGGETQGQGELDVQREGPGKFRIGSVTLDSVRREVAFPAMVNMDAGVVEYALVTDSGKVHEALFSTSAKPEQIHLACLLLGKSPEKSGDTSAPKAKDVKVTVTWETNGPPAEHDLSQMVVTADDPTALENARPLPIGPWCYNGSVTDAQGFAATREGSIIALISDPSALVNDPRETSKHDDIHFPNKALVPPRGNSVRIVLTFPDPVKKL